jgi:sigma-B regulation protein RsbU (phosphoserine phosphatase)
MEKSVIRRIQNSLEEKRQNIYQLLETTPSAEKPTCLECATEKDVQAHLDVIDTTLQKADNETLGICSVCQGSVETSVLEMDYTATVCLDCLSNDERRQLEAELELSQVMQRALLPQEAPSIPGLDVAAFSRPAQIVGGDYFDFIPCDDGSQAIAIADIVGHGISASMLLSSLQATLRTLLPENSSPGEVLRRINHFYLHNVNMTTFVTVFLAKYDPRTRTLSYLNAGHNPPILFRRESGKATWLHPTGAAIGIIEDYNIQNGAAQLAADDVLVLYTDGVTEASNAQGEYFGTERLVDLIRQNASLAASEVVAALRQALGAFIGERSLADDTTIIVCKVAR